MLKQEYAIGNYTVSKNPQRAEITDVERTHLVLLIEQLAAAKNYKMETLFLAVSLADRYLTGIARDKDKLPCLVTLGLTCTLLAAKIE